VFALLVDKLTATVGNSSAANVTEGSPARTPRSGLRMRTSTSPRVSRRGQLHSGRRRREPAVRVGQTRPTRVPHRRGRVDSRVSVAEARTAARHGGSQCLAEAAATVGSLDRFAGSSG